MEKAGLLVPALELTNSTFAFFASLKVLVTIILVLEELVPAVVDSRAAVGRRADPLLSSALAGGNGSSVLNTSPCLLGSSTSSSVLKT